MTLEQTPLDTSQPFTRAAALAAGLEYRLLRTTSYRRLLHGVYVDSAVPVNPLLRARAALLRYGNGWASHMTAARVHGIPVPASPDEHVTVVERVHRHRRLGVVCHHAPRGEVHYVDGVRVSAPAQTFVELASLLPLVDLVAAGDHLVRHLVALNYLVDFCAGSTLPSAIAARRAVRYVRTGVDSPMETRIRMLLVLAGLPEPEVNPTIRDGEIVHKYDLRYRSSRTIVEYDGRQHVEREAQWESDLRRREEIDDGGERILVLTARDVYRTPELTLARVHRILRERGEPGVKPRLSEGWRRHFPGQSAA